MKVAARREAFFVVRGEPFAESSVAELSPRGLDFAPAAATFDEKKLTRGDNFARRHVQARLREMSPMTATKSADPMIDQTTGKVVPAT